MPKILTEKRVLEYSNEFKSKVVELTESWSENRWHQLIDRY